MPTVDSRGHQFIGFSRFSSFETSAGARPRELVLTSPVLTSHLGWDELIASWNAETPADTYLKIEVRALYPERATKYYVMGLWSSDPARFPRESVLQQKDDDGDVSTDTLRLKHPCSRVQVRLTLGGALREKPKLKFLGLCLTDTQTTPPALAPNPVAWGRLLPVPERSQMLYSNGNVLCSPTTVSMLMGYWAHQLKRPEIDQDVPEIAKAVYDANWKGTGNWPFNTAYAGSYRGMRAYVTRLSDISELEDWVAQGIPVGLSVCYDRLRGKPAGPNGHLVLCVGFTQEGDPIINDPGTSKNVRKIFARKNLIQAWAYSHNTVYLIYPQNSPLPKDRFGHWDSWSARQRIERE
ncbi:MAG TPA: C39 family peptidase [Candidatus Sulfotelmatobacter sp.]|nr:C39 family peptidase [Candidatus Sulfotelmatobacter sp.]